MIARLLIGLKIGSRWLRSAAQFAALVVLALTLSSCVSSPIGAAAGGATAHDPHWCREHRFYRYDLAWHLHHCGGWCTASGCGH